MHVRWAARPKRWTWPLPVDRRRRRAWWWCRPATPSPPSSCRGPRTAEQALAHDFVGAERAGRYLAYLRQHGLALGEAHFKCYADNSVAHWALVRRGLGIGAMMDEIASVTPDVVRVLDDLPPVKFPIWLVTHRELRTARRIRVVFDLLAEELAAVSADRRPHRASPARRRPGP